MIQSQVSAKPMKIASMTVRIVDATVCTRRKKYRSNPMTAPTASRISQMAVACLKFSLKDLKKLRIVELSSSRTSFRVT